MCRQIFCFMRKEKSPMHKLTDYFKPHLAQILEGCRKHLKLTQLKMAEKMAISSRYYHDLKYGISMNLKTLSKSIDKQKFVCYNVFTNKTNRNSEL